MLELEPSPLRLPTLHSGSSPALPCTRTFQFSGNIYVHLGSPQSFFRTSSVTYVACPRDVSNQPSEYLFKVWLSYLIFFQSLLSEYLLTSISRRALIQSGMVACVGCTVMVIMSRIQPERSSETSEMAGLTKEFEPPVSNSQWHLLVAFHSQLRLSPKIRVFTV